MQSILYQQLMEQLRIHPYFPILDKFLKWPQLSQISVDNQNSRPFLRYLRISDFKVKILSFFFHNLFTNGQIEFKYNAGSTILNQTNNLKIQWIQNYSAIKIIYLPLSQVTIYFFQIHQEPKKQILLSTIKSKTIKVHEQHTVDPQQIFKKVMRLLLQIFGQINNSTLRKEAQIQQIFYRIMKISEIKRPHNPPVLKIREMFLISFFVLDQSRQQALKTFRESLLSQNRLSSFQLRQKYQSEFKQLKQQLKESKKLINTIKDTNLYKKVAQSQDKMSLSEAVLKMDQQYSRVKFKLFNALRK